MVNMGEAFAYDVIQDQECELVPLTERERERFLLDEGDLLFVRQSLAYAGAGRCVLVGASSGPRTWESHLIRARLDKRVADSRFIYYYFRSPAGRSNIETIITQVAAAGIKGSELKKLQVPRPSLMEQQGISAVLGALDEKIELNERIRFTSDELLRSQYQAVCLSASESISIGKLGKLVRDGVSLASLTGGECYIGLEHMPRRNMWMSNWEVNAELASGKSAFRSGDVLFGRLRPYFHKVGLALTSGVCSTDILVIRPTVPSRLGWLLLSLSSDKVVAHASAVGDGTRMPRTKWQDLDSFAIPWPGEESATHLNELVRSLGVRIQTSVEESRTLATLRDTLLPRLMSGRLRVEDAEKIVEDHV